MRLAALWLLVLLVISGCGGGGGGGGTGGGDGQIVGRVLDVQTGGPVNPSATVQADGNTTSSSVADGSFSVGAANGTDSLLVDTNSASGVWQFDIEPVSGTTDVGDLWVGPQRVTLIGTVVDSIDSTPVAGAVVRFGGRQAVTNALGDFSLAEVAYSSVTQTAFWGILGSVEALGYFLQDFSAAPHIADSGVVDIGEVLVTPVGDDTPPPIPANITGRVLPLGSASGTIVTLKLDGNAVRVFNVGSSGSYGFWVEPGDYTIEYQNGTATAPTQSVSLDATDEVVRVPDVTLSG